jgi:hypothetical protein
MQQVADEMLQHTDCRIQEKNNVVQEQSKMSSTAL